MCVSINVCVVCMCVCVFRYLPSVMADGLVNQINNPEVEVDVAQPNVKTRQLIMELRVATNRLRQAHNGRDADFIDSEFYFCFFSLCVCLCLDITNRVCVQVRERVPVVLESVLKRATGSVMIGRVTSRFLRLTTLCPLTKRPAHETEPAPGTRPPTEGTG